MTISEMIKLLQKYPLDAEIFGEESGSAISFSVEEDDLTFSETNNVLTIIV